MRFSIFDTLYHGITELVKFSVISLLVWIINLKNATKVRKGILKF